VFKNDLNELSKIFAFSDENKQKIVVALEKKTEKLKDVDKSVSLVFDKIHFYYRVAVLSSHG
jgi:hypothetical protein